MDGRYSEVSEYCVYVAVLDRDSDELNDDPSSRGWENESSEVLKGSIINHTPTRISRQHA